MASSAIEAHLKVVHDTGKKSWTRRASMLALLRHAFGHSTQSHDPEARFPLWLCVGRAEADALGGRMARRVARASDTSLIIKKLQESSTPFTAWAAEIWDWLEEEDSNEEEAAKKAKKKMKKPLLGTTARAIVAGLVFEPVADVTFEEKTDGTVTSIRSVTDRSGKSVDDLKGTHPFLQLSASPALVLLDTQATVPGLLASQHARDTLAELPEGPSYMIAGTFDRKAPPSVKYAYAAVYQKTALLKQHFAAQCAAADPPHNFGLTARDWLNVFEGVLVKRDGPGGFVNWVAGLLGSEGKDVTFELVGYIPPNVRLLPFLVLLHLLKNKRIVAVHEDKQVVAVLPSLEDWDRIRNVNTTAIPYDLYINHTDPNNKAVIPLALYSRDPNILTHQPQALDDERRVVPWIHPDPVWTDKGPEYKKMSPDGLVDAEVIDWTHEFTPSNIPLLLHPAYARDRTVTDPALPVTWAQLDLQDPELSRNDHGVLVVLREIDGPDDDRFAKHEKRKEYDLVVPNDAVPAKAWAHFPGQDLHQLWEKHAPEALALLFLADPKTGVETIKKASALLLPALDTDETLVVIVHALNISEEVGPAFYENTLQPHESYDSIGAQAKYAHYAVPYVAPADYARGDLPNNAVCNLVDKRQVADTPRAFYE